MNNSVYFILPLVVLAGVVYMIIMNRGRAKAEEEMSIAIERKQFSKHLANLLNNEFDFIKNWMKDAPIDAFTTVTFPETMKQAVGQLVGEQIKRVAFSAISIKYRAIKTPSYLVLSGKSLHYFGTDVDGSLDEHIVFGENRLESATLHYGGVKKENLSIQLKAYEKYLPTYHSLAFNLDGQTLTFDVHNRVNPIVATGNLFNGATMYKQLVYGEVVGEQVIAKLKERFSNL
jgi:hypothetical protein